MKSFLQSLYSQPTITYQAEQWSSRLGDECNFCHKKLTHQKCISLCRCYYFCHQQCFTQSFQKQIYDERTQVNCQKCRNELQLEYSIRYEFNPSLNTMKGIKSASFFILTIICFLAIFLTLACDASVQIRFLLCYLEGLLLSYILYQLILSIRNILYNKIVKIKNITSTKLDIQTSAFKDIQLQTNDQLTKQIFNFSKKK